MKTERMYHSVIMLLLRTRDRRTNYLKKHNILADIGDDCVWVPWLIPLYPKMIKLHNNVHIHKTAKLVPHDVVNGFLKKARPDEDFGSYERLGCIEIMDNVYVSMNVIILPDVRIGKNCIITAGSVVSSDIPDNSIVAGNPAKVIGRFDAYVATRKLIKNQSVAFRNQELPDEIAEKKWEEFTKRREERNSKTKDTVSREIHINTPSNIVNRESEHVSLEDKISQLLSEEFTEVDFSMEEKLIDDEMLDSVEMMSMISLLESEFDIKIPEEMVDAEHFNSIRSISTMITKILKEGNACG